VKSVASPALHWILLAVAGLILAWSGFEPKDRMTWVLEVAPAVVAAFAIALLYPRWKFTPLVLILIAIHAAILMVGGKYTYAEVPAFNWLRDEFGLARNYYDRVGHFAQGFVPAMIAREVILRRGVLPRGKWLFWIIAAVCLAISALYEFLEWWVAAATGEAAEAFLGTQGDVWDTQWDMFLALCGALIAQLALARWHDRQLGHEEASGTVSLRELNADNIDRVGDLRVTETQKVDIAGIAKTIWQGIGRDDLWLRAVYAGETPVGFVALVDRTRRDPPVNEAYIARLMVDQRYQGRGFGRAALALLIAQAQSIPGATQVRLSHMPGNRRVGAYYEAAGFRYTGEVDEAGELEMLRPLERGQT